MTEDNDLCSRRPAHHQMPGLCILLWLLLTKRWMGICVFSPVACFTAYIPSFIIQASKPWASFLITHEWGEMAGNRFCWRQCLHKSRFQCHKVRILFIKIQVHATLVFSSRCQQFRCFVILEVLFSRYTLPSWSQPGHNFGFVASKVSGLFFGHGNTIVSFQQQAPLQGIQLTDKMFSTISRSPIHRQLQSYSLDL